MVCSKMPPGLMFTFFVSLLQSGFTQKNPNHFYILDKRQNILLLGPDIPGNGPVAWDWEPHSGEGTQRLMTLRKENYNWQTEQGSINVTNNDLFHYIECDPDTVHLRIMHPTLKFTGSIILVQIQPSYKILKMYEIFGIKVETSPEWPVVGSDVTLSCTISRLSDTVSLHWKRVDSSQQNRTNTDQIRLNNTVYQMLRHVTQEDGRLHECEVQENGNVVLTGKADFTVNPYLYQKRYTLYRSDTDRSELHLVCYSLSVDYNRAAWTWDPHLLQSSKKVIASAEKSEPANVTRSHFVNRLEPTVTNFNGRNLTVRISPVVFDDAGVYTCALGSSEFVTITLITVKVRAEPSSVVTEGDTVTLTCSVSDVTESMRLVWINGEGKTAGEKILNGEEKSLSLIILKSDRGRGKWMCGLFYQDRLQLLVPYYLQFSDKYINIVIIGSVALVFIIILGVVLCLKKCRNKDLGNQRQKPLKTGGNAKEASHLYSNAIEIQQMQGDEKPVPETGHIAEYMSVDRKSKEEDSKDDIHYGSISFKNTPSGSRHDMQCSNQSLDNNTAASNGDNLVVIYAQMAQVKYE